MRYLREQLVNYHQMFASNEWGPFTVYLEIDDQHVTRQVNVYKTGQILKYDRSHWCDDFGMMFVGRFSRKQKATRGYEIIKATEFEKLWKVALQSELWPRQLDQSRENEWGTWKERVADQC